MESGVGDDPKSYAYDGKRLCKWNGGNETYGEQWGPGIEISILLLKEI